MRRNGAKASRWIGTLILIAAACLIVFGTKAYNNAKVEDAERLYRDNATAVIESRGFVVVDIDAKRHLVLLEGPKGEKMWANVQQDGRDFIPTTACAITADLKVVPDTCAVNRQLTAP